MASLLFNYSASQSYSKPPVITPPPGYTMPPAGFDTNNISTLIDVNYGDTLHPAVAFLTLLTAILSCLTCHCCYVKLEAEKKRNRNTQSITAFSSARPGV